MLLFWTLNGNFSSHHDFSVRRQADDSYPSIMVNLCQFNTFNNTRGGYDNSFPSSYFFLTWTVIGFFTVNMGIFDV